jgi:hypothetical protein
VAVAGVLTASLVFFKKVAVAGVLTASLVCFKAGVVWLASVVVPVVGLFFLSFGAGLNIKEEGDMGVGRDEDCVRVLALVLVVMGGGPAVAVAPVAVAFLVGGGPPLGGGGRDGGADLALASRAAKEASKRRATLAEGGTCTLGEAGGRGGARVVGPVDKAARDDKEGEGGALMVVACVVGGAGLVLGGALVAVVVVVAAELVFMLDGVDLGG